MLSASTAIVTCMTMRIALTLTGNNDCLLHQCLVLHRKTYIHTNIHLLMHRLAMHHAARLSLQTPSYTNCSHTQMATFSLECRSYQAYGGEAVELWIWPSYLSRYEVRLAVLARSVTRVQATARYTTIMEDTVYNLSYCKVYLFLVPLL